MTRMAYNCKECGRPGVVDYEPEFIGEAEVWKARLVCNRCGDFLMLLSKLRERAGKISRFANRLNSSEAEKCRLKMVDCTKEIARAVCAHWRVQTVWEPDFVDQLMERPEKTDIIIKVYAQHIKKLARKNATFPDP